MQTRTRRTSILTGEIARRLLAQLKSDRWPVRDSLTPAGTHKINVMVRHAVRRAHNEDHLTGGLIVNTDSPRLGFLPQADVWIRLRPAWTEKQAIHAIERAIWKCAGVAHLRGIQHHCQTTVDAFLEHHEDKDKAVDQLVQWCAASAIPETYQDMNIEQCYTLEEHIHSLPH